MRTKKIDLFLEKALEKMFQSVGFEGFDKEFTKKDNWFSLKSWTKVQEQDFRSWFLKEAKSDLKWSKAVAEREFSYFNFMYGWSQIEEPQPKKK
jgi:hypothetical protein